MLVCCLGPPRHPVKEFTITYKQIQDAVIYDLLDESQRADVKNWINFCYTRLCDLEDWSFMRATAGVTVTNGSQTVTNVPTDFAVANALRDQYGSPLQAIYDPAEFVARYMDTTTTYTGQPEAFCVFGSPSTFDGGQFGDGDFGGGEGIIAVGPTSNVTSGQFRLLYERAVAPMSLDADTPIIPSGYHMVLVADARAFSCRMTGLPESEANKQEVRETLDAMRAKYLTPMQPRSGQSPAYRPC